MVYSTADLISMSMVDFVPCFVISEVRRQLTHRFKFAGTWRAQGCFVSDYMLCCVIFSTSYVNLVSSMGSNTSPAGEFHCCKLET